MSCRKKYEIKNDQYETKIVVAEDMGEALSKYKKYLETTISVDFPYIPVFKAITSCKMIGTYAEDDYIL